MFSLTRQEKLLIIFLIASFLVGSLFSYLKNQGKITQEILSGHFIEEQKEVNINTAGEKKLVTLKGIGYVLASRIVEYREKYGPFKRKEDLKKVKGIGPHKFEAVKEKISVE